MFLMKIHTILAWRWIPGKIIKQKAGSGSIHMNDFQSLADDIQ